jgi:hypothetical protein
MIGEPGARISIKATANSMPDHKAGYMTATASLRHSHPCARAGSIYDKMKDRASPKENGRFTYAGLNFTNVWSFVTSSKTTVTGIPTFN